MRKDGYTLSVAYADTSQWANLEEDGRRYAKAYLEDAQFVFSRVQHHVHKKDKDGYYIPLNACRRRDSKKKLGVKPTHICKHNFPMENGLSANTLLLCPGLAKRFHLSVTGKRNSLGLWLGRRTCVWQSGTTPALATHFRSNTNTMPNHRLPPLPEFHSTECKNTKCKAKLAAVALEMKSNKG